MRNITQSIFTQVPRPINKTYPIMLWFALCELLHDSTPCHPYLWLYGATTCSTDGFCILYYTLSFVCCVASCKSGKTSDHLLPLEIVRCQLAFIQLLLLLLSSADIILHLHFPHWPRLTFSPTFVLLSSLLIFCHYNEVYFWCLCTALSDQPYYSHHRRPMALVAWSIP